MQKGSRQMLRIERDLDGETTIIRLIGRIQAEHVDQLKTLVSGRGRKFIVNLEDVTLVDVQVVRFFGTCQQGGIELRNCPPYIREWILREHSENG
jgi:anti-anti-sigma regulatory factor